MIRILDEGNGIYTLQVRVEEETWSNVETFSEEKCRELERNYQQASTSRRRP